MYMIFLLALLPDRNTSPHCWPNIHNRVVFLKLDAKILSKVSSLLLVDKEWSGGDLRELIYDRVLNAFFPQFSLEYISTHFMTHLSTYKNILGFHQSQIT